MAISIPYLQIEPTTRCNFTCGFCVGRTMNQGNLTLDMFEQVITGVSGLKHIQLQGEGEPFSHPDLFRMISIISRNHPEAKISITTNGTYLSRQNIERILNVGNIYSILVSIESPSPETFRKIRGGDLNKIKENMGRLQEEKRKRGISYPVLGLAVTVMNKTFSEFGDIVNLYKELSLDGEFTIQYLQNMETYSSVYDEEMSKQIPSPKKISEFRKEINENQEWREFLAARKVEGFFDEMYANQGSLPCVWLNRALYINQTQGKLP